MGSWDNEEVSSAAVSHCCLLCRAGSTAVTLYWAMPMHPSLQWKHCQHQHPQPRTLLMRCHIETAAQGVCDQQNGRSLHLGPVQCRVYSLQLPTWWLTPIPRSQQLCSSVWQPFFLCGVKEEHREMSFATHHMNGHPLPPFPPSSIDLIDLNYILQQLKIHEAPVCCHSPRRRNALETPGWEAKTLKNSVPGCIVRASFCRPSLGCQDCPRWACDHLHIWAHTGKIPAAFQWCLHFYSVQNRSPPEWKGLSAKRLNHRSSLMGLAGADPMSKD